MLYLSELLNDPSAFKRGYFNLINAPCGAGKSHMIANCLLSLFPDVRPCEILYLTSRSIIVTQQLEIYPTLRPYILEYDIDAAFWRGDPDCTPEDKICLMTYDKAIHAITSCAKAGTLPFDAIKIIVVDECHALLVDTFIDAIQALLVALRYEIAQGQKLVIGMTATPQILFETPELHGFRINCLCEEMLPRYTAKQLVLTPWQNLPTLLCDPDYAQKTIVMVQTRRQAIDLQRQIPNSAIIVSRHNDDWCEKEMLPVWLELIHHKKMPAECKLPLYDENYKLIGSENGSLRVLILTSVAREGLNICEESGIRNVVCCIPDALHITQFLGRCRYNVDNLILTQPLGDTEKNAAEYLLNQRNLFSSFVSGCSSVFFQYISHLLQHDAEQTIRYTYNENYVRFYHYLEDRWLITDPLAASSLEKLLQNAQRHEIVAKAHEYHIFELIKPRPRTQNFPALLPFLNKQYGFEYQAARVGSRDQRRKGHFLVSSSKSS